MKGQKKGNGQGRLSLHPIPFQEVLADVLQIPPEPTKKRRQGNDQAGDNGGIRHLGPKEGRELFDRLARRNCGMSGHDFISAWNEGRFKKDAERPEIAELAILIPLHSED